jgi:hypothetical protein
MFQESVKYEGIYIFGGYSGKFDQNPIVNNTLTILRFVGKTPQFLQPETTGITPSARFGHSSTFLHKLHLLAIFGG